MKYYSCSNKECEWFDEIAEQVHMEGCPRCSESVKKIDKAGYDLRVNERIKKQLNDVIAIQGSKGNYDVSEYMRGMANGLLLAQSILNNKEPEYK